ncbi:MAG: LacI family DNA-binding transcriptional regulator [Agathobacter sp.]|nr:LacI family DNA-binding transcriptional regulator [Agathobacter sp.]
MSGEKNITISDVAEALGVSKTTVSRAISGKGRIGEATRQKVLQYIEEHDYKPNVIAKSLAQSKTFNICVVMPGDYALVDLPFFQEAIMGIQEIAGMMEYDILLCICQENDITGLQRIIMNRKVDGVILLRTVVDDPQIDFLMGRNIPFVATGSSQNKKVIQIDHDHKNACKELTSIILMKGMKRISILGGDEKIVANQTRMKGIKAAYEENGTPLDESRLYMNLESRPFIEKAVEEALEKGTDCILCMDDAICSQALRKLREKHVKVPKDVKVASFYNSSVLENNVPSITSLSFDARELGMTACKNLLNQIEEVEVPVRTLLPYEVILKESTT